MRIMVQISYTHIDSYGKLCWWTIATNHSIVNLIKWTRRENNSQKKELMPSRLVFDHSDGGVTCNVRMMFTDDTMVSRVRGGAHMWVIYRENEHSSALLAYDCFIELNSIFFCVSATKSWKKPHFYTMWIFLFFLALLVCMNGVFDKGERICTKLVSLNYV